MPKPLVPNASCSKPQRVSAGSTENVNDPNANDHNGSRRPVKECRHRNLRATIWKNETEKGVRYNVTLNRMYKDGEQWKDSQSFGFDELMNLAKLLADAHTCISEFREKDFVAGKGRPPEQVQDDDGMSPPR